MTRRADLAPRTRTFLRAAPRRHARAGLSALAAAAGTLEHEADTLFIAGGDVITPELFRSLATSTEPEARARLSRVVAGTVLAPIAPEGRDDGDAALLTALLRDLHRTVRLDPVSLAVVLEYVLRLRAELQDLSRVIWGIAMQLPRRRIIAKLVTARPFEASREFNNVVPTK